MNWIARIAIGALAIYLTITLIVYTKQRDLMFAPDVGRVQPSDVGLASVSEVTLKTPDGLALHSWYGTAEPHHPTILFFHGNSGNVSRRADKFRQLMTRGYGVFMLGYPGYGGSDGTPSEAAFVLAASLSFEWLRDSGITPADIVVYGESLGTAVAVQLVAVNQVRALILEAPMSSVREMAQSQYPYLPVGLLLKDPFLTVDYIDKVRTPLLIVHGVEDSAIPITNGEELFERAKEPKKFVAIEGAGHSDLYSFQTVDEISAFLNGIQEPASGK